MHRGRREAPRAVGVLPQAELGAGAGEARHGGVIEVPREPQVFVPAQQRELTLQMGRQRRVIDIDALNGHRSVQ